jgi:FkbM family methyltransferase
MGIRRTLVNLVELLINARIVRPGNIAPLWEEEHLRRFLRHFEVDCIFDVGANIGQYGTMLRKRAGYKGTIISFEPIPEVAAKLKETALQDGGWYVEEVALGAESGRTTFNVTASNQMSSLHLPQITETELFKTNAEIIRKINVRMSTLAHELPKYQKTLGFKRPFLKMDTQGHDVDVALGAGEELKQFVGLQSELAIKRIYAGAPNYEEAITFYRQNGFTLSALVPNNLGHFPQLIEIDCIMFRA